MSFKRISIVVPVLNAKLYIEDCLKSIFDQNYENIEILVIDGGSTDGTVDIIEKFNEKIAYWESEKDDGQSFAINKGLKKAEGDIVAWLNADERYLPGTLQKINEIFKKPGIELCYGNTILGNVSGSFSFTLKHPKVPVLFYMLLYGNTIPSDGTFWTRNLQDRVGYLDEVNYPRLSMDYDWFLRLARESKKCIYIDRPLSKRIVRPDASTQSAPVEIMIKNRNQIFQKMFNTMKYPRWLYLFLGIFGLNVLRRMSVRMFRNRQNLLKLRQHLNS